MGFQSFPIVVFRQISVIMPSMLIAFAVVGDGLRDALDPQSNWWATSLVSAAISRVRFV